MQDCHLAPGLPRTHRWNYWCFATTTHALSVTLADVGYVGVVLVSFLEYGGGAPIDRLYLRPFGLPFALPDSPRGDVVLETRGLRLAMIERGEAMHVLVEARTILGRRIDADLVVERPLAHETINVLVPWGETRFSFTSKQQALPARGLVRVDGRPYRFTAENQGFACLDFGRGRWPDGIDWHWAFASGRSGDRVIGLNLGAGWTDGTGVTENGFVVDGRLHKIAEEVAFHHDARAYRLPWRLRSERVDLVFQPACERVVKVPLGPVGMELHQLMGTFRGTLIDDGGARVVVDGIPGLAERVHGRW